ncbi:oxidoreductase [Pseudomonas matsuisoli]|uniref:Short-chain dehydrogenase/reductase n=1 Tax=Pseudomonas matsuisoli TaxID=1515666 RepID=A0A917V1K8_9PSED|nr:oxidoreductase [Pseudomonas matsuisoli]GGK08718.1 short-chain dehydrogenase/reductase [Pseudomonas matsuisoli]
MTAAKTIFITGVSSGFGHALAHQALAQGHRVIGTVRSVEALASFEALSTDRAHGVIMDVTHFDTIDDIVADVVRTHEHVDVLVNNAGYGHEGVFEESPLDEMRKQFDVNVFGVVAVTKAFVPLFRQRRAGHILNITSMGGYITMPGIAYYCASKFALEGLSDTLSQELRPFNIHVTAVAPGSFRTDWAGRSMRRTPRSIDDYDDSFNPIREARQEKSGAQLGNPDKAALAMLEIIASPNPPTHLLLGSDALALVRDRLQRTAEQIDRWEHLTLSTDG